MSRFKDALWILNDDQPAQMSTVQAALLMDLRDEMKKLNAVFACPNFLEVPRILRRIARNTAKPKRKAKAARRKKGARRNV